MSRSRTLVLIVSLALALVVGFVVIRTNLSEAGGKAETKEQRDCAPSAPMVEVRGIVGSEKEPFLRDATVTEILKCEGIRLKIDPEGSRRMVDALKKPGEYDYAFPSSSSTARKIAGLPGATKSYPVFSSVMGVASWSRTVELLRAKGVVVTRDGYDVLVVSKLVDLALGGTRWNQLPGNEASANRNLVLVTTTDPADSNSAIMFLSILSAELNDGSPVSTKAQLAKIEGDLCRLMADQGEKKNTSEVLFDQYLTQKENGKPLVMAYESQFLDQESHANLAGDGEHKFLYPEPTVYAQHTVVAFSEAGDKLGDLLEHDAELQEIATSYGYRPNGEALPDRPTPTAVEAPDYELLESMLGQIEEAQSTGGCQK
jgi:hypothetical protein